MNRLIPTLAIAALLSAALLAWRMQNPERDSDISPGTIDSAEPLPDPGALSPSRASIGKTSPPPPPSVEPSFVSFLQTEAKSLDAPSVNTELAEKRLAAQAEKMGENEIRYARDLALGPQNAANQRILAAFLLGAAGAKARSALSDLALVAFNSSRAQPHSVDELKNTQAKAISLMAIDALFEQARQDRGARDELQRLLKEVKDDTLRKHIHQRLHKLPQP